MESEQNALGTDCGAMMVKTYNFDTILLYQSLVNDIAVHTDALNCAAHLKHEG